MAVFGVAAIAAVLSFEHASALVRAHGESGWTGRLIPLTVDGLIYASSMVLLDPARRGVRVPSLARWLLALGIVATLAANVAHGLATVPSAQWWPRGRRSRWVGSYELLIADDDHPQRSGLARRTCRWLCGRSARRSGRSCVRG